MAKSLKVFREQLLRYKSVVYEYYMTPLVQYEHTLARDRIDKPTILVIEDNLDEWFLIRQTLGQLFPTIDLVWASTAVEAAAYLNECVQKKNVLPCLILVDLYLPTAKLGLGLLKALKTHHLFKEILLITISRSSQPSDIVSAFERFSACYIVKPDNYVDWQAAFIPLQHYIVG